MKKQGKIRIRIEFDQTDGQKVSQELTIDMLDSELSSIDACEQELLKGAYKTMRSAMSAHFSELSKKKEKAQKLAKTTE